MFQDMNGALLKSFDLFVAKCTYLKLKINIMSEVSFLQSEMLSFVSSVLGAAEYV